jgi:polyisoprenoid-binding protein YceI
MQTHYTRSAIILASLFFLLAACSSPAANPTQPAAVQPAQGSAATISDPATAAPAQPAATQPPASAPLPAASNPQPAATQPPAAAAQSPAGAKVFQLKADETQAQFNIYEELRGTPKTVVGNNSKVSGGSLTVDLNDLSSAHMQPLVIDSGSFVTDSNQRNGAIRNFILFSGQNPNITFNPTQITGLSGSAQVGQTYTFQLTGDLTIRTTTRPVTFDVTVKVESPDRLSGSASTTVQRQDFGLEVPNLPFLANVGQDVKLQIDFVLTP